jgi:hypothetical protein
MLLRIKQTRKLENGDPGTDIILGKGKSRVTLPFRPFDEKKPDRDHVCDVADEHVGTLLAIKEGFEIHPSVANTAAAKAAASQAAATAASSAEGQPASAADLSDDELEAELERRRAAKETSVEAQDGEGAGKGDVELSRAELLAAVEKKTGKKPNPATSTKKLKELLAK